MAAGLSVPEIQHQIGIDRRVVARWAIGHRFGAWNSSPSEVFERFGWNTLPHFVT
jgi:hypothetical protein